MPKYYDVNVSNALLKDKESSLGFAGSHSAKVHQLKSAADAVKVAGTGLSCIEAEDCGVLREALKRCRPHLVNPVFSRSFERDDALVQAVKDSGAFFELPLQPLVSSDASERAKHLFRYSAFLRLCSKHSAPFVITSRARHEFELKSPREMIAIASLFGLSFEQARNAVSARPEKLLKSAGLL